MHAQNKTRVTTEAVTLSPVLSLWFHDSELKKHKVPATVQKEKK